MKKAVVSVLLFSLFVCFAFGALATETVGNTPGMVAKVTTAKGSLNLRAKPSSTSAVKDEIPNGACLLLLEEGDEWCLCQWKGKTGYCATEYLTILREADVSMLDYRVLRPGDKGQDVLDIKIRLMELGYIRSNSTLTNVYNDILSERIALFQRELGITEDGKASQELQAYLFSDRAPTCTQTLPKARVRAKTNPANQVPTAVLNREICGCCMGDGCECCDYKGWIYY